MTKMPITRALLSVSDKTGLLEFARFLAEHGVELISTGGTAELLRQSGLAVRDVSEITRFPEMMDGRVKTLHPGVHGGLLAKRSDERHRAAAAEHGIGMIDLLVVNLYPFEATLAGTQDSKTLIENIDVGGPAMIRAAAKNHESVTVLVDAADYAAVQTMIAQHGEVPLADRRRFAAKAFARTAAYDTLIAAWMSGTQPSSPWPAYLLDAQLQAPLRYGENPHQQAALYTRLHGQGGIAHAQQLQGKELSYNNLSDANAAWDIVTAMDTPTAAIIKHANPCGVAVAEDVTQAFKSALQGDPVSAFGGILAVNRAVDQALAEAIGSLFLEVIVAPEFSPQALAILGAKKNLRLLIASAESHPSPLSRWMVQAISGGYLVQTADIGAAHSGDTLPPSWQLKSGASPAPARMRDALLAWAVVRYVKSNAIVLVKDGATIGIGAGQMSRVDAVRIAIEKARAHGHSTQDSVLASDAFFPFADNVELAAAAGIGLVVQPGGSVRDAEVIDAATKHGMAMLFTSMRHFRH